MKYLFLILSFISTFNIYGFIDTKGNIAIKPPPQVVPFLELNNIIWAVVFSLSVIVLLYLYDRIKLITSKNWIRTILFIFLVIIFEFLKHPMMSYFVSSKYHLAYSIYFSFFLYSSFVVRFCLPFLQAIFKDAKKVTLLLVLTAVLCFIVTPVAPLITVFALFLCSNGEFSKVHNDDIDNHKLTHYLIILFLILTCIAIESLFPNVPYKYEYDGFSKSSFLTVTITAAATISVLLFREIKATIINFSKLFLLFTSIGCVAIGKTLMLYLNEITAKVFSVELGPVELAEYPAFYRYAIYGIIIRIIIYILIERKLQHLSANNRL